MINDQTEEKKQSCYHLDQHYEIVDNNSWITDNSYLFYNELEDYWEIPVCRTGLVKVSRSNAYHGSLLIARSNYVASRFISGGGLQRKDMQSFCRDYFMFGDAAFLKIRNHFGQVVRLHHLPSIYLRQRNNGNFVQLLRDNYQKTFKKNDVIFVSQYDPEQQIYGLPDYLGSLQSSLLNSDATTFRRRYYLNGAHLGFIFYATDSNLSAEDEKMMKDKISSSRGVGNFKSMFVNIPNGKEKGIQLIPVGDISTRDEFEKIKNITAQDILTGHRFPVGKAGIIPSNAAGLGDPEKVGREYARDEIIPVCELIQDSVNSDPEITNNLKLVFNTKID